MAIRYEWAAERVDGEDIIDTRFSERLTDLLPLDPDERLALVRDEGDNVHGLIDRMWAYPAGGILPTEFTYCGDEGQPNGVRVPARFHRELSCTR